MQATRLLQHNKPPQNELQHHNYRVLQVFKSNRILNHIEYYSSHLTKNTHSYLQQMKKLSIRIKPPYNTMQATTCSNVTIHQKTNFQHHKYRVLQVFKSN